MTVTIVAREKQVVGPAEERKPLSKDTLPAAPPNNPKPRERKPIATPDKMSPFAIYRAIRNMAIGDLMLSYPEMSRKEAEARVEGDVVVNELHASALKLKAQL